MASFNVNGQTVHSLLSLPVRRQQEKPLSVIALQRLQERLKGVECIIIDEIPMCSQKTLFWIDHLLREASVKKNVPLGGYHVIIVGDFAQIPPVRGTALYK